MCILYDEDDNVINSYIFTTMIILIIVYDIMYDYKLSYY